MGEHVCNLNGSFMFLQASLRGLKHKPLFSLLGLFQLFPFQSGNPGLMKTLESRDVRDFKKSVQLNGTEEKERLQKTTRRMDGISEIGHS